MTSSSRPTPRAVASAVALVALVAAGLVATGPAPALAAPPAASASLDAASLDAASTAPATASSTVTADVLPTPQIDGVVWSVAVHGTTAYAVGAFTTARPSGAAAGQSAVRRANAMAFDVTTGRILGWDPSLGAQARTVEVAPDGRTVYVGGDFSTVGGVARGKVAAFSTATGALTSFAPRVSGSVWALAPTADALYVVGSFGTAGSAPRANAAAFAPATGDLLPWAPATDGITQAVVAAPDGARVIIGGRFQVVGGEARVGITAVDGAAGGLLPFEATPVPARIDENRSWVTDLTVADGVVYGTANGEGGHWFDGRFAVRFDTGALVWLDNCYGASYGTAVLGEVAYAVSHSHDCSSVGAFPEQTPSVWKRATANTLAATGTDRSGPGANSSYSGQPVPTQLPWYPTLGMGTYTKQYQGAWAAAATTAGGGHLVLGGEFPSVNGTAQQGLAVFAPRGTAPGKVGPQALKAPEAVSLAPGRVRVTTPVTWDPDDATLSYDLLRDSGTTPVASTTAESRFWALPTIGLVDAGAPPGSTHTYRVRATDASGNAVTSPRSSPVVVTSGAPDGYGSTVAADGATASWPLDEPSGAVARDHAGTADAVLAGDVVRSVSGPLEGQVATSFAGTPGSWATTSGTQEGPQVFTVETWFRTTSTTGGKIVGFGDGTDKRSDSYDRHVYLDGDGRVTFGVHPGWAATVTSAPGYADGEWHLATASLGPDGMRLSLDGVRVAARSDVTGAQAYQGRWRIGGDSLGGWPGAGGDQLGGDVARVAVYPTVLSPVQVDARWVASGRTSRLPAAPTDRYGRAVAADEPELWWRLDDDAAGGSTRSTTAAPGDALVTDGVATGVPGAVGSGTAYAFDGERGQVVEREASPAPSTYSAELWFSTTTARGGKLIGYGDSEQGQSGNYDRHVYLQDDGRLVFGTWTGSANTVTSARSYADGAWHHVVATQSAAGMVLSVDGEAVGSDPQASAQGYQGRWHVGGDTTWGSSSPYVAASIDEVAVYPEALTAEQVRAHHAAGTTTAPEEPENVAPTAVASATVDGLAADLDGSASTDPDGSVVAWSWDLGDGGTASGATVRHAWATAGTRPVTLTVTDDAGATATHTVEVTVTAPPPTGPVLLVADAFERSVSGGFGTADAGGAWTSSSGASAFSVADGTGRITMARAGSGPQTALPALAATDAETRITLGLDKVPTGAGTYSSLLVRAVPGQGDYRAKVTHRADGSVALALFRQDAAGAQTVLGRERVLPGVRLAAGRRLEIAVRTTGTSPTTLEAAAWPAGSPRPADWTVAAVDATPGLQVPGRVGLHAYLSGSATNAPVVSSWDDLTITTTGEPR